MSAEPFRIQGPALISFSGGRTSAYMLRLILDANGGMLAADVHVVFANTGKERPETLQFVHEVETRWLVKIHWVEWRATPRRAEGTASLAAWLAENDRDRAMVDPRGFAVVGHNSACGNGEPFEALIAMKQRLPNWQERWCTEFLKVAPITALAASFGWGPGEYLEVIGLRDDEGHRVLKALENANFRWDRKTNALVPRDPPRQVRFPLASAKLTKAHVMAFWADQPFDLGLKPHEGNCDLCFMKGRKIRKRLIRDVPGIARWWNRQETIRDQFFDRRDRVAQLIAEVQRSPEMWEASEEGEHDVECGLHCAPMEAA